MQNFQRMKGITLLEVIVSISILIGLLIASIPSYHKILNKINAQIALEQLQRSINYARAQAITNNQVIRLCPSDNGKYCSRSKYWQNGWITYIDHSNASTRTDSDPILQVQERIKNLIIRKNGRETTIKFNSYGQIGLNRSFSICFAKNSTPIHRMVVIQSGRIRIDKKNIICA